ncbi:MAG TPA: DUF4249 domain-containing protein [Lentimicrobium sp.]|nr:DUF4249 domain-containing protein [Lentimicrobium sp.]
MKALYKYLLRSLYVLPILLLTACEDLISDVDAPVSSPKLVVNAVLIPEAPDTEVYLFLSTPLYTPHQSGNLDTVSNAVVIISSGNQQVTIPFDESSQCYRIEAGLFPVIAGQEYSLLITTPSGYRAEASCTIPADSPPAPEVTARTVTEEYGNLSVSYSFRFRDIIGEGHYYATAMLTSLKDEFGNIYPAFDPGFDRGERYSSDAHRDGEYFNFKTSSYYEGVGQKTEFMAWIAVTDRNYYMYHRSVSSFEGEDPFSEPVPVFTNIKGGLGYFGAARGQFHILEDPGQN